MRYWWVNHKATHAEEIEGEFIWAPALDKQGKPRHSWENLKLVKPGDVVISYAHARVQAVGTAVAAFRHAVQPDGLGPAGAQWAKDGYLVPVAWVRLPKPWRPTEHIEQLRPLLPAKHSPLIAESGHGSQASYLASISNALGALVLALSEAEAPMSPIDEQLERSAEDAVEAEVLSAPIPETEKRQLVLARQGHGRFRAAVMERAGSRCRVTGVEGGQLLVASHIKPWRLASNEERLDGANGLLLSPHVDRLFDRGMITFESDGRIRFANPEVEAVWAQRALPKDASIAPTDRRERSYLEFHRAEVFRG